MEVREIVNEEIKKGMRVIHKKGYENKGWREEVKAVTDVVMTTNGTHSHVVYDNGGLDYLFDFRDNYYEVVDAKHTGIPTFDGITQEVEDSGAVEYLGDGDILPEANFSQSSWKEPTMISVEDLTQVEIQPTIKSIAESVHKKEIKKNKEDLATKYPHYYKSVENLDHIDVYDVLKLFNVTDPCLQHSIKKLLALGERGHKDHDIDFKDAMDTLERYRIMRGEHAK